MLWLIPSIRWTTKIKESSSPSWTALRQRNYSSQVESISQSSQYQAERRQRRCSKYISRIWDCSWSGRLSEAKISWIFSTTMSYFKKTIEDVLQVSGSMWVISRFSIDLYIMTKNLSLLDIYLRSYLRVEGPEHLKVQRGIKLSSDSVESLPK